MVNRAKSKNFLFATLALAGLAGALYEGNAYRQATALNATLASGKAINLPNQPFINGYSAAYQQGGRQDYKHAIQSYSQLLELPITQAEQARVQFNIGNNLMRLGLARRMNDDGSLIDDARYEINQAKTAYEQALRLAPDLAPARFNLSLLHSILPKNLKAAEKDQSGVLLSNLPIGLP